jgi:spore coat polysaccharide biosynthesis protein SpsF (cytidylyltransferase family)
MSKVNKQNKKYNIAAVLPCRINSTRLLAKPLQYVGKFTILELLIKQLKKSSLINEIVLAISESIGRELFVEVAKKNNIKFVFGDEIDVLGRLITGAHSVNADILFRVTAENPFIFWEGIDSLIQNHLKGNFDLSFYGQLPLGSSYELVNVDCLELAHKLGKKKHRSEYSTMYFYENPKVFSINRMEPKKSLHRSELRLTVDTPQDLWVARLINDGIGKNGKPIPLEKIINFLDSNKKIIKINSNVKLKYKKYVK